MKKPKLSRELGFVLCLKCCMIGVIWYYFFSQPDAAKLDASAITKQYGIVGELHDPKS